MSNTRKSLLPVREWVVYREYTDRQVFTGIQARTREEAIEAWKNGAGELQKEREQRIGPVLDAVDIKAGAE